MIVMERHNFFDEDVEKVLWRGHEDNREIVLSDANEGALIISKEDIIALAKEFNLVVYEKDSSL